MQPAVFIRLWPRGPWRFGPGDGGESRLDALFRSDRVFAALTAAAKQLGWAAEWLDAMTGPEAPLALSSLFPFQGDTLFVVPPATLWPPPAQIVTAPSPVFLSKVRWQDARFVPALLVDSIVAKQKVLADQWIADPESGCLLRRDRVSSSPFRTVLRRGAAVDRISGVSSHAHTFAGVEFEPGSGLWMVLRYRDEEAQRTWHQRLHGVFRLLADTGFGGRRTSGWGQIGSMAFEEASWPRFLMPRTSRAGEARESGHYWLLSLFAPSERDQINWNEGAYELVERGGANGQRVRMVAEGSVIAAAQQPLGAAIDMSGGKRVFRSGLAFAVALPDVPAPEETPQIVEEPATAEALEPTPCESAEASTTPEANDAV